MMICCNDWPSNKIKMQKSKLKLSIGYHGVMYGLGRIFENLHTRKISSVKCQYYS